MNPDNKIHESARNALLVEGPDDLHTIIHLVRKSGITWSPENPEIPHGVPIIGISRLLRHIGVLFAARMDGSKRGIVLDADNDFMGRWWELRDNLSNLRVNLPAQPTPGGDIVEYHEEKRIRVGVWIMPDHQQTGSLEDFLLPLIPESDLWGFAQASAVEAREKGALFPEVALKKAKVRTWLAWQEEPGQPYGKAIDWGYFKFHSPQTAAFVSWFRRLFLE